MTCPPPSKNTLSTCFNCWNCGEPTSASKLPEVPAPITASASPLDAILRVSIALLWANPRPVTLRQPSPAASVALALSKSRRMSMAALL
ncbi:hypothetical protein D3C75_1199270 [compost metagenome]